MSNDGYAPGPRQAVADPPAGYVTEAECARRVKAEREAIYDLFSRAIFYPEDRDGYETPEAMAEAHRAVVMSALNSYPGAEGCELTATAMALRQAQSVIRGAKARYERNLDAIRARQGAGPTNKE